MVGWTALMLFLKCAAIVAQMSDKELEGILQKTLKDKNISSLEVPPTIEGQPLEVTVNTFILDISNVDEIVNAFTVDMLLFINWEDLRFKIVDDLNQMQTVSLDLKYEQDLWTPYLILSNAVLSQKNSFNNINVLKKGYDELFFLTNGRFRIKKHIIDKFMCKMDLRNLPFDTQVCTVEILSHTPARQMLFRWSEMAVEIRDGSFLRLNKFTLKKIEHENDDLRHGGGHLVTLKLTLQREYGYYIYQGFIPSAMVVCVSWIIFWVNMPNGDKVTLEVMLLLTMTTLASFLQSNLPQVSYLKFLDIWFFLCTTFVFMTLMQIVFQHLIITRKKANSVKDDKNGQWIDQEKSIMEFGTTTKNSEQKFMFWCKITFPCLFVLSIVILFCARL